MSKNAFGLDSIKSVVQNTNLTRKQIIEANKALLSENAAPILQKAIQVALDDDHPGQMAAMKMCMDRILPMSEFEAKKDGGRSAVTITITGIGETKVEDTSNVIDAEDIVG